ncbi:MAG: pre-peptidase C-terminal domain-containing protein [Rudaea sp.]
MMRRYVNAAYLAIALSCFAGAAFAQTALAPNTTVTLAPGQVSNGYYFDVDASAKSLTFTLSGTGGDLDLFVRYATPFPQQVTTVQYATVDGEMINRYAQYHSINSTSNDSITILPDNRFPLKAGRWYVTVANDALSGIGTGTLTATVSTVAPVGSITFDFGHPSTDPNDATNDCDDSFWTDTTAATPVGGNPGTTLGEQRKNALDYAGQQLVQQLGIQVPLVVHACGAHLGGDGDSAPLAQAGPTTFLYDTPQFPSNFLPKKYTWYPSTIAVRLGGATLCSIGGGPCDAVSNEVIEAVFNEDIGNSDVIGGEEFYFGYTTPTGASRSLDFVSIAMHEMTHGLGFTGLVNTDDTQGPLGAKPGLSTATPHVISYQNLTEGPYDDIYDDSVAIVDSTAKTYQPFLGYEVNGTRDALRGAAMTSGPTVTSSGSYNPGTFTDIRWSDPVAASSSVNINASRSPPDNFPSLYAPCDKSKTTTCETQPSSTLSHTVQAGDMMNAFYSDANLRSMGLAVPMLAPLGWSTTVAASPSFTTPSTGNWYDVAHSGHGFDFQIFAQDSVHGDVYGLTFYTYDSNGKPEWYQAVGNLVDGVFVPSLDANGNSLHRITYQATTTSITSYSLDPRVSGSVTVDFNQAQNAPECRNRDRSGASQLAVMYWNIGADSGFWCVQPIAPSGATPNGMWYASSDSGWGFELVDVTPSGGGSASITVVLYLPGPNGQPNWLIGSGTEQGLNVTIPLLQTAGYCRACTPVALATQSVGTMSITFDTANPGVGTTTGKATISVSYPGGGSFVRDNIRISLLSLATRNTPP